MTSEDKSVVASAGVRPARQRRIRADAQRNMEALLQSAAEDFAKFGVDVPIRELAERAGVGVATLYRHFPSRSDLILAVYRRDVDASVEALARLSAEYRPGEALFKWVDGYVEFIAAHSGLAQALNSGDAALEGVPAYFQQHLGPGVQRLLDAAAQAGEIRNGVRASELIYAVAKLCVPASCGEPLDPRRMVSLFMDGLRYGAR